MCDEALILSDGGVGFHGPLGSEAIAGELVERFQSVALDSRSDQHRSAQLFEALAAVGSRA